MFGAPTVAQLEDPQYVASARRRKGAKATDPAPTSDSGPPTG